MHRLALIALILTACGGASKHEPAWPKSAGTVVPDDWKDDGGESIDPRVPTDVEQSESDDAPPPTSVAEAVGNAAVTPAPAGTGGATYGGASAPVQVDVTSDDGSVIVGSPPPPPSPSPSP